MNNPLTVDDLRAFRTARWEQELKHLSPEALEERLIYKNATIIKRYNLITKHNT